MTDLRKLIACLPVALLGSLLAAPAAVAQTHIKVTVVAILATDRTKDVTPCLECLAKEIRKTQSQFTGFRAVRVTRLRLEVNQEGKFPLVDQKEASAVVLQPADKDNWVTLKVRAPGLETIVYRSKCGKFFPLMTGYETGNGERLFIAVAVAPCPGAAGGCHGPDGESGRKEGGARSSSAAPAGGKIRARTRCLPVASPSESVIILRA